MRTSRPQIISFISFFNAFISFLSILISFISFFNGFLYFLIKNIEIPKEIQAFSFHDFKFLRNFNVFDRKTPEFDRNVGHLAVLPLPVAVSSANLIKCCKMVLWLPWLLLWSFLIQFLFKIDGNPHLTPLAPPVLVSYSLLIHN